MIIDIVRHGQTNWNLEWKCQWQKNIPLNHTGIYQAKKISERLKHESYDKIYVSNLERAIQTMEEIKIYHSKTPLEIDSRLQERSCWNLEWSIEKDIDWSSIEWTWLEKCPLNGESINNHLSRTQNFINDLWNIKYKNILIVCHWGTLECVLNIFTWEDIWSTIPKNCAFYRFKKEKNHYSTLIKNSDSHL